MMIFTELPPVRSDSVVPFCEQLATGPRQSTHRTCRHDVPSGNDADPAPMVTFGRCPRFRQLGQPPSCTPPWELIQN